MKKLFKQILVYGATTFLGSPLLLTAQQIKATIETKENGFQTILVPQDFRTRIGNDIGSLRIINPKGEEVPFVLKTERTARTDFQSIAFTRDVNTSDSTEIIVLENPDKRQKQRYFLKIVNSTATKPYTIEGSDDQQTWFSLVPQGHISNLFSETETFSVKSVSFPLMDYRFVRIILDNKTSAPINILDIGQMETVPSDIPYERLQNISWKEEYNKQKKESLLSVSVEGRSPVDFIKIHISAPSTFLRDAEIYQNIHNPVSRKKGNDNHILEYITLANTTKNEFIVEVDGPSDFHIRIFNEDNPPLKIDSITLYQKAFRLLAELQQGFTYTLDADTSRRMPSYDLAKMNLQLPDQLPHAEITKIEISPEQPDNKKGSYGNTVLILSSIIGVLIVFYFGNSLLKDMKKGK